MRGSQLGVIYVEDCLTLRRGTRKCSNFDGPPIVGDLQGLDNTTQYNV